MSGIPDHQTPSSVCNEEGCDREHQDGKHVSIFREEEAYKVITALQDANLQLGYEFGLFTAPYFCQPSYVAIEEVQKILMSCKR
jgi:hypothetical protein